MNKTAIKNFAVWARNKLIADISYRAGLMGITESGIASALPQSTGTTEFYDIGTAEPYVISGDAVRQRRRLVELIERKEKETDYKTAYKYIIEEVAYTWFNRLIAIRFMEVNDYLPSHIRVLSSESGKMEPDIVTNPYDTGFEFSREEEELIIGLKRDNKLDELFCMLFIKQCNELNEILPELFERTKDYTELLLNISFVDQDGIVSHLVNDIAENDFNVERGGQVEIIGWLYQYYNTEPKDEAFALLKKNVKITKERIPAVTQLFTPDWIVQYMVENSLGRFWLDRHRNEELLTKWHFYLQDCEQEIDIQEQIKKGIYEDEIMNLEKIKLIDPCMGSGHILVRAFDVLMDIYESIGYNQREAAISIINNNIYGLDIDDRAYQMAYFAVMMKARQYNRRIFNSTIKCHLYSIKESNEIDRKQLEYFGIEFDKKKRKLALEQINLLLDLFRDAKEYGSILNVCDFDWPLLSEFIRNMAVIDQFSFENINLDDTKKQLCQLIEIGKVMAEKYNVVITNPPYMGSSSFGTKLSNYVKKYYADSKSDLFSVFIEKCSKYTSNQGYYAMITQPSFLFLSSYERLRQNITSTSTIISLLHMGRGIFGVDFGSTSFVIKKDRMNNYIGQYYKLHERTFQYIDPDDICNLFKMAKNDEIKQYDFSSYDTQRGIDLTICDTNKLLQIKYTSKQSSFEKIPGTPIAYWVSDNFIRNFDKGISIDEISDFTGSQHITANNDKYLRYIWEIPKDYLDSGKWKLYAKGGDVRKWYGNLELAIDWTSDAVNFYKTNPTSNMLGEQYREKEGITYSEITSSINTFRYLPEGCIFDKKGPSIVNVKHLYYCLALFSTPIAQYYFNVFNPTLSTQVRDVKNLPIILCEEIEEEVNKRAIQNVQICKDDWDSFEVSKDFCKHPLTSDKVKKIEIAFSEWKQLCEERYTKLKNNEEWLNEQFIRLYSLQQELSSKIENRHIAVRLSDRERDIKSLLSFAVGCLFGRYSVERADTVAKDIIDSDNIIPITDEAYLKDDIVSKLCDWLKVVYGEEYLEDNLDYIADSLSVKGKSSREVIRNYFMKEFFGEHCKIYQKRPIYWLFDSGKQNGFKALIYIHRYNANTIGDLRIDYLHRMQRVYESEINRMQDMIDHSTNSREVAAATKRKEKLQKQLKECREYDEKIGHLALSRIEINLDDGVKVNYEKVQTASDGKKYQVLAKI